MNKERILVLANHLQNIKPYLFSMNDWGDELIEEYQNESLLENCDSAACIAGWTVILFDDQHHDSYDILEYATELLDLDKNVASNLFTPILDYITRNIYTHLTKDMAIEVLYKLVETGEVSWRSCINRNFCMCRYNCICFINNCICKQ